MSYYFAIIGTKDNPLFEHEFGTSKQGGDGIARFREDARHMNQFIVHSSLDIVEEVQWGSGNMYLKHVDRFHNNYIFCFITGSNVKFLLLHNPEASLHLQSSSNNPNNSYSSRPSLASSARSSSYTTSSAPGANYNPTAPTVEEATKNFFVEVYDAWVKTVMNPFYRLNMEVTSPVFRGRVAGAARKYL